MLKVHSLFNTEDKKEILKTLHPKQFIWVVSDIKSRDFIQQRLNVGNEDYVYRAEDLWFSLLSSIDSTVQIVSRNVLVFLYQKWASSLDEEWKKTPQTGFFICQYLKAMMHLLQHNMRDQLAKEWFSSLKAQSVDWKKWYDLAVDFWEELKKRNIIESSWADVFLLDHTKDIPPKQWEGIVFDLGCSVNCVELELMHEFSSHKLVHVLAPVLREDNHWKYASPMYCHIDSLCKDSSNPIKNSSPIKKSVISSSFSNWQVRRFSSQLAEVKDIVYEVKKSLENGVSPQKIAVLAPQIEDYWVCLKSYFKKEHIAVNKREVTSLSSFRINQLWLARLWTHIGVIEYPNLEMILSFDKKHETFSQFRSLYYYASKLKEIPSFCYNNSLLQDQNTLVSGKDFFNWAKKLQPQKLQSSDSLTPLVSKSIKNFENYFLASIKICKDLMPYRSWLSLLESFFKKKEVCIRAENAEGINCLSFNAIGWLSAESVYIAGLNESNMNKELNQLFSDFTVHSIRDDLGFFIKLDNPNFLQQTIKHFIQQDRKKVILSCSRFDFSGKALNPSSLWIEWNHQLCRLANKEIDDGKTHTPQIATWDRLQRKKTVKEILVNRKPPFPSDDLLEQSLKEDLGEHLLKPYCEKSINKLSCSTLSDYIKCPFVYSIKKLFGLWSGPQRDDVDRSFIERGFLIHSLFEQLTDEDKKVFSEEEILTLIKKIISEKQSHKKIKKLNTVMSEKEIKYLARKIHQFLEHETQARQFFKNYKVQSREVEFKCYWNQKEQSLSKTGEILFSGVIDRVDSDGYSYKVIDYKSSHPKGAIADQWIKKMEFQLPLYIQALEQGLVNKLPPLPVDISLFLSYKDFNYQGLVVKKTDWPEDQSFGKLSKRAKSMVSDTEKQKILSEVNLKINRVISNIQSGQFAPNPLDFNECNQCQWRRICRAKHLN